MTLGRFYALLDATGKLVVDESGSPHLIARPGPHFYDNARRSDRQVVVVEIEQMLVKSRLD